MQEWASCIQNSPEVVLRDDGLRREGADHAFPSFYPTEHPFLSTLLTYPEKKNVICLAWRHILVPSPPPCFTKLEVSSGKSLNSHCVPNRVLIPVLGIKPFSLSCSLDIWTAQVWRRPFHARSWLSLVDIALPNADSGQGQYSPGLRGQIFLSDIFPLCFLPTQTHES